MTYNLIAQLTGCTLHVACENADGLTLRIHSAVNEHISKYSDISPRHPHPEKEALLYTPYREMYFPVVDLKITDEMTGVCVMGDAIFAQTVDVGYSVNPASNNRRFNLSPIIEIPATRLEQWENSLFTEMGATELDDFYLALPVTNEAFSTDITTLCDNWGGSVELWDADNCLASVSIAQQPVPAAPAQDGAITKENIARALEANTAFVLKSQNTHPHSKTYGSFYLFYDYAAKTWRQPSWLWGCGPATNYCLEMAKRTQDPTAQAQMIETARGMGDCAIRHIITEKDHPAEGIITVRYHLGTEFDAGACGFSSPPDSGFYSGWALVPLYQSTGDVRYLEAAKGIAASIERLMKTDDVIVQDYDSNWDLWASRTLDEAGFGIEVFNALYHLTGDEHYKTVGVEYTEQLLSKLDRADGLWERKWSRSAQRSLPCSYYIRGLGWAMEGLLMTHALEGSGVYLEKAIKMAEVVIAAQKPDGSWNVEYDKSEFEAGISEKGTALWSYLFYLLYDYTKDETHLASARKALSWCLANQSLEQGEGFGGIAGTSAASGVTYRRFFPLACSYTAGFFGLALLKEKALSDL